MESQTLNPKSTSCWSNIVKQNPTKPPINSSESTTKLIESCNSTKGIAVAVIDANAIIQGGEKLHTFADKFVSVNEVLSEIRDPNSRHRMNFLPFDIRSLEPSPESLKKVISFARATGDLQTLSDVDLKLIALTYTLEVQFHGTTHLRDTPPPVHVVNVRRLPEKDLPGWGDNVPNLAEWEALEGLADSGPNSDSKILPLKDLNLNTLVDDRSSLNDGSVGNGGAVSVVDRNDFDESSRRHKKYSPKKREVKIDGKKMVADGIDASLGQCDDDGGEFRPAVSRSTHRRFLRRQARREMYGASINDDDDDEQDPTEIAEEGLIMETEEKSNVNGTTGSEDISLILEQMRLENQDEVNDFRQSMESKDTDFSDANLGVEGRNSDLNNEALDHLENGSVDTSLVEDDESEQSWMLRSLSESSVACVTGDFAMQNVILQMGLRLVAPGGMQIRELHRWVLKCHACNHVTAEVGRIFCPKCGNGGTLRKVSATVGENGVVLAARKPRISLRGTKFSLPLPQGGRDAMSKNPILREDQIPKKYLYERTKKKSNKDDDGDFFTTGSMFSHHIDKKNSNRPPVRQALAVFSGKRNPNDNHYSRSKH
ncbi:hypothetical protein RND81_06G241500 [Saponaria officinalis]|uniref:RNA-binding protein NOB1 n=1 Tax=Saponaria officinalis TaxID=3572 RepID=A0AAW1KDQ7_SAPOF